MKIQIEGEPKEIAELLQAIESSREQHEVNQLSIDGEQLSEILNCHHVNQQIPFLNL